MKKLLLLVGIVAALVYMNTMRNKVSEADGITESECTVLGGKFTADGQCLADSREQHHSESTPVNMEKFCQEKGGRYSTEHNACVKEAEPKKVEQLCRERGETYSTEFNGCIPSAARTQELCERMGKQYLPEYNACSAE